VSNLDVLLARNRAFAGSGGHHDVPLNPRQQLFVITCLDPRTDPAAFLGLQGGDAMVIRNAGGRVSPAVIDDVAFISYLAENMAPDGPLFEVAVVHHTGCGTGLLANDEFRHGLVQRTGLDERDLLATAVVDPAQTVRTDVERLLSSDLLPARLSVSGHVYTLATGLVDTILTPAHPHAARIPR